ncbi:hypothetical protein K490DRAFT_55803 [Saccharata proteae CBS 121410]|uniref:Zn(2)-C6 fungal-type domain-containing protein n=1 Tax=Saccharata proteae CBS 121410 TaxID=1314787 RepID=A0A6A5YBG5_9PEZI|nr:hypothetical protein K490DRAFT_55803 [Saccharata proteae CBS 121410]
MSIFASTSQPGRRCDGARPTCGSCTNKNRRKECIYDAAGDQRRTAALKQRIRELEDQTKDYKDILSGICSATDKGGAILIAQQLRDDDFRNLEEAATMLRQQGQSDVEIKTEFYTLNGPMSTEDSNDVTTMLPITNGGMPDDAALSYRGNLQYASAWTLEIPQGYSAPESWPGGGHPQNAGLWCYNVGNEVPGMQQHPQQSNAYAASHGTTQAGNSSGQDARQQAVHGYIGVPADGVSRLCRTNLVGMDALTGWSCQ